MEVVGTRVEQEQGAATELTLVVVPSTFAKVGSVFTTKAFLFTVKVPLPLSVPPRCKSPFTVLACDEVRLSGVQTVPAMVEAVAQEILPFPATSPPSPPFGVPTVLSKPSVVSEPLP